MVVREPSDYNSIEFANNDRKPRGNKMKSRAAVAWEAGQPLSIEEVDVKGPKESEV